MSIIKYRTGKYGIELERVECEKETAKCVWIRRINLWNDSTRLDKESKCSKYSIYHDSWASAHAYLVDRETTRLQCARESVTEAEKSLATVKAMKAPAEVLESAVQAR
jgi:hypothetical protein